MTWQGVPWAVGGGAVVGPEVARLLAYIASNGDDGVVTMGDLQVRPLAVPGAGVRIMPGAASVLNRAADPADGGQQSYLVRKEEQEEVALAAQPAGGGVRYDLVAVVVEDPQYAGQPAPASVPDGPYVRTAVYSDVGAGVDALADVDPGQAGMALALVKFDASDGTVVAADITDLRDVIAPRVRQVTKLLNLPNGFEQNVVAADYVTVPNLADWNVKIPAWAVKAHIEFYVHGVVIQNDSTPAGEITMKAKVALGTLETQVSDVRPDVPNPNDRDTFSYACAGELDVPKALRGSTVSFKGQMKRHTVTGGCSVRMKWGTTVVAKVTFFEAAASDAWDA